MNAIMSNNGDYFSQGGSFPMSNNGHNIILNPICMQLTVSSHKNYAKASYLLAQTVQMYIIGPN